MISHDRNGYVTNAGFVTVLGGTGVDRHRPRRRQVSGGVDIVTTVKGEAFDQPGLILLKPGVTAKQFAKISRISATTLGAVRLSNRVRNGLGTLPE
ncbi:MAG: hypothetical protein ACLP0J_13655 [Solirubrobacteraceae bacterium]